MDNNNQHQGSQMFLNEKNRYAKNTIISDTLYSGVQIGFRNFITPNLNFRLGLLWVVLDPLFRAMVFTFLLVVIRGYASAVSLIVGIFTIACQSKVIRRAMSRRLSDEPFPMSHTPDKTLLASTITSEVFTAIFLGISGATLLIVVSDCPPELLLALPISCCILAILFSGAGLLLQPMNLIIKDIGIVVGHLLRLSFFLQCVIYPYSNTTGLHRDVLYWLPHTIVAEWSRAVAFETNSPFSLNHSVEVIILWSIPMVIGYLGFSRFRWRSSTWS